MTKKVSLESNNNNGTVHEDLCTCMIMSRRILLRMGNIFKIQYYVAIVAASSQFRAPHVMRKYVALCPSSLLSEHSHGIRLSWPPLAWGLRFHPLAWGLWSNKLDKCWKIHLPVKLRATRSQRLQRLSALYITTISRSALGILFCKKEKSAKLEFAPVM